MATPLNNPEKHPYVRQCANDSPQSKARCRLHAIFIKCGVMVGFASIWRAVLRVRSGTETLEKAVDLDLLFAPLSTLRSTDKIFKRFLINYRCHYILAIMEAPSNPNEDESVRIVAAVATVTSVAVSIVAVRLYVRASMIHNVGWDDALITLTTACAIVGLALTVVQADHGAGKHRGDVAPEIYKHGMLINFVSQPVYLFAICFVKLAVGAALMRIATQRTYKRLILGVMIFMLFYTIGCFFTIIFQCSDIRVLWDPAVEATCWTPKTIMTLSYTNAALNILTDLLFSVVIPLPMLWRLHVNFRTWVTLMFILGIGVFACAAASVKVSYLTNYGKTGDLLWDSRDITIWTATELNVAIAAASLPCLKPLFKRILNSKYGNGSYQASRKQRSGSWYPISGARRKSSKHNHTGESDSQVGFELGDCHLQAFVNDDSTTSTEIGQAIREKGKHDIDEESTSSTVPDKGIFATTTTSVHFSKRFG